MLSPDGAADLLQVTPPNIAELIVGAVLHTAMTPANSLLICSNSILIASAKATKDYQEKTS